jgi:Icc-related predicted phosphoesterase
MLTTFGMAMGKTKESVLRNTEVKTLTVADLHQNQALYSDLTKAVEKHQPDIVALVGDFLHAGEDMKGRLSVADCAKTIASLPCKEVIFTRGNHEDENWPEFIKHWPGNRELHALNGEVFQYGPLSILAFPCYMGCEDYFLGGRETLECDTEWLRTLMHTYGSTFRTMWLMHEPPIGTPLSASGTAVEGNELWNEAIAFAKPLLTISGHDHVTPINKRRWHHKLGSTTCVNVGQTDSGPLRYSFVNAEFASDQPSLPKRMAVTAYPMGAKISL